MGRSAQFRTAPVNGNLSVRLVDLCPQRAHTRERARAIGSGGKIAQARSALRDGGQHAIAMRDAFVSGKTDRSDDVFCGLDYDVTHECDLPRKAAVQNSC